MNSGLRGRAFRPVRSRAMVVLGVLAMVAACSTGSDDDTAGDDAAGDDAAATRPVGSVAETPPPDTAENAGETFATPVAVGSGTAAGLSVAATTVDPFERIRVTGVEIVVGSDETGAPALATEPDISDVDLFMYGPGLEAIPMDLFVDEDGVSTVIGMNPLAPFRGGEVELQFVADGTRSPATKIELSGLTPVTGTWDATIATVMTELGRRAVAGGSSLERLASADLADLDPDLRIVKLVAGAFDDGTDADLGSLADGLTDESLDLLDALVDRLGFLAAMPFDVDGRAGISGFASPVGEGHVSTGAHPRQGSTGQVSTVGAVLHRQLTCTDFPLTINDGATLSEMIHKGVSSQMGSAAAKLTGDVSALNAGVGKVNDSVGLSGGPAAGAVAAASTATAALDALYAGLNLWKALDAGRYPSQLNSIRVELSTTEFNEDFVADGAVQKVEVVASSTGFDASSFGAVATSITNVAVGSAASNATKNGLGLSGRVGNAIGMGLDKIRETATGKAFGDAAAVLTDWCPQTWTVDITSPEYVQLKAAYGKLGVDDPGLGYRPTDVGDDFLTVSARPGAFAGQSVYSQFPIRVHELQVVATPSRIEVKDPGAIVQITASAEFADTPSLEWDPGMGSWNDGAGNETPGGATRPLLTPTDPDSYPFVVTVTSTSETGLREGKSRSDPREDTVEIELQDFVVLPDPGSVLVNRTLQFVAIDRDGEPVDVEWSATGGQISASGVYLAGDLPGTYTVTATSRTDPTNVVTVDVVIGEAVCLVGTWELRSQEFLEALFAAADMAGAGMTDITWRGGTYRVQISDDGSASSVRDDWSWSGQSTLGALVTTMNGTTSGNWSATEDTLVVSEGASTVEVAMGIDTGGGVMPLPIAQSRSVDLDALAASGVYSCDGDVLTITASGVTSSFDRVG